MELRLDGTMPEKKITDQDGCYTTSTSTWTACPHHTGWYFTIKFLWFKKKLYWCDLCHRALPEKYIRRLLKK